MEDTYEGRGAGGKLRKPTAKKRSFTPYARPPPTNNQNGGGGGWLSKIVDPACRLITGGATKIFPSFFSKPASFPALPPAENNDKPDGELTENADDSIKGSSSSLLFRSAEGGGQSEVADELKKVSDHNEFGQDDKKNLGDGTDFSSFEQLLKGKTFSREEINHLLEILNSRVDVKEEKKTPGGGDAKQVTLTQEIPRTPVEENQQDGDRPIVGSSIKKGDVTGTNEIPRTPLEGKQKDIYRHIETSLQKADVTDAIGASPIDIAQAYMGSRTSERGNDPYSFMSKSKRAQPLSDEFITKSFMPPPSPKPYICWPGAEVHGGRGYVTPQSQRGRYGHLDFPRTPYSRTIASESRTKLQNDSRFQNRSPSPFQQSQKSIYGQEKVGDTVDSYGSVGPIRRIRNKFASEIRPRGSIFQNSSKDAHPEMVKPSLSKGFLPSTEKKLEHGESSASKYLPEEPVVGGSEPGFQNINQSSSSEAVRKILEHLDRNKPTPKEKAAELKLATAWRKTPDEETSDTVPKGNISSLQFGELDFHKNTSFVGQNIPKQLKNDSSNANFPVKFQEKGWKEVHGDANENVKASGTGVLYPSMIPGATAKEMPTFGLKNFFDPQVKNLHENSFITTSNGQKEMTNSTDLVPSKDQSTLSHGNKPFLPSISINRPNPRAVSSDNGLAFTFPVSASSGVHSEPPTPSIMPLFSTIAPSEPKDVPAVPSYSFGTNNSTPRLVFSFPFTSTTSTPDASDIKFQFGSDKKARLSFNSFGKDTICC